MGRGGKPLEAVQFAYSAYAPTEVPEETRELLQDASLDIVVMNPSHWIFNFG